MDLEDSFVDENVEIVPDIDFAEIYEEAMDNLKEAKSAWSTIHQESNDDRDFGLFGNQWNGQQITSRRLEGRTTAVFNKCVQNIRYVVNSSMKEGPSIKVSPIENNKKKEAEAIAGIVRHIENESNAKDIYSSTFQDAVAGGLGVFEICVDDAYEEPIKIKRIIDPTSVSPDPFSIESDFSDMTYLFHEKNISKKEFERKYPGIESRSNNKETKDWFSADKVTIVEYWKKDGENVEWYILNGNEVIDSSILNGGYKGKYIPYVFIIGEDVTINGERHLKSIIRDIKDYQRTLNYMQSEAVDFVSKNAKAPYIATDKSVAPYKHIWDNANTKNYPYLPYEAGQEKPQRLDPPPAPVGFIEAIGRLDTDIRSTIGIKDPLQDIPASQSAKAIKLQLATQNLGTYIWVDHLNRAIKHCGRIIVDLIQYFYNYPHTQQIIGLDGQISTANIQTPDENGISLDLSGKYSVTISTGASYEDQRQETRDQLLEIFKINPAMLPVGSDLLVRNMDFVESTELADRLFAMLPPQIKQLKRMGEEQDPNMILMQMKQQMEEMGKVLEQTTQALNIKTQESMQLQEQLKNKSEMEMQKIQMTNEGNLQKEVMSNQSEEQQIVIKGEYDLRLKQMEFQHQLKLKELELEIEKYKSLQTQNIQIV